MFRPVQRMEQMCLWEKRARLEGNSDIRERIVDLGMAAIQGTGAGINLDEEKGLVVKRMNAGYSTDILFKRLDLRVKKL